MHRFTLSIAGHSIGVESLFASTRDYCGKYLTENPPEFTVTVTETMLRKEQDLLDREADEEGLRRRVFPDPFLERSAIQRTVALELLKHRVLLLHGSCLALEGKAYLFTAPCGTGKSTHARLWREAFPEAVTVNDDKPFLTFTEDGVLAWGAPWSGKHGLDTNIHAPLGGICILARGDRDEISPLEGPETLDFLTGQALAPEEPDGPFPGLMEELVRRVPLWQMRCTKNISAAYTAHKAMTKASSL